MTHPVWTPTSPTKAAHRSPWHRMPFRLSSTSSRGMRLSSSSSSIVKRGQSFEYEQQAPQELQIPTGVWDLCGAILLPRAPAWRSGHVESGPRNCRIRAVMRALSSETARMRRSRGSSSSAAVRALPVAGDPRIRLRSYLQYPGAKLRLSVPVAFVSLRGSVFDSHRLPRHALDGKSREAMAACLMLQRTSQALLSRAASPGQKSPQMALQLGVAQFSCSSGTCRGELQAQMRRSFRELLRR
jgi:hypothetical protein